MLVFTAAITLPWTIHGWFGSFYSASSRVLLLTPNFTNDEFGGKDTIVGYECDGCEINGEKDCHIQRERRDADKFIFWRLLLLNGIRMINLYDAWQPGREGCAVMGLYQQGGTVLTVGMTDWSHGLAKLNGTADIVTKSIIDVGFLNKFDISIN